MIALAAFTALSCSEADHQIGRLGGTIDEVESKVDEFGSITMSTPVLAPPTGNTFAFDLSKNTPDTYFASAKTDVQAQAAALTQEANSLQLSGAAQLDPSQAGAFLAQLAQFNAQQQQYLQAMRAQTAANAANAASGSAVATPPAPPAFPGLGTGNTPASAGGTAAGLGAPAVLSSTSFKDASGLLPTANGPVMDDHTAILVAAANNATQAIFKLLGDPSLGSQFKDRQVLFGVSMVSVNPGWRTRHGYTASIRMMVSYEYGLARAETLNRFLSDASVPVDLRARVAADSNVPLPASLMPQIGDVAPVIPTRLGMLGSNVAPSATIISPLTETQALDLSNSDRRQTQFALELSFALRMAGLGVQADAFEAYVKSTQQDFRSRTPNTAVNAFSYSNMFGFEVGPRLTALDNPGRFGEPKPANTLDRQSFPSLILIGMQTEDLRPAVVVNEAGKYVLREPQLKMSTYPSWTPQDRGAPRLSETDMMQLNYRLRQATATPGSADAPRFTLADVATLGKVKGRSQAVLIGSGPANLRQLADRIGVVAAADLQAEGNESYTLPVPDVSILSGKINALADAAEAVAAATTPDNQHAGEAVLSMQQQRSDDLTALKATLTAELSRLNSAATALTTARDAANANLLKDQAALPKLEADEATTNASIAVAAKSLADLPNPTSKPGAPPQPDPKAEDAKKALTDAQAKHKSAADALSDATARENADSKILEEAVRAACGATERLIDDQRTTYANYWTRVKCANAYWDCAVAHQLTVTPATEQKLKLKTAQNEAVAAVTDEIQDWAKARVATSDDPALEPVLTLAKERGVLQEYRMFGGHSSLYFPYDLVEPPAAPPTPKVAQVVPSAVQLHRDASGAIIPQQVSVAILGTGLMGTDLTASKYVGGTTPILTGATFSNATSPVTVSNGVVLTQLNIGAPGAVVLKLAMQGSTDAVLVPAISVNVDDGPPGRIRRRQFHIPFFGEVDDVSFTSSAPVQALSEMVRQWNGRLADGPASVNVEVRNGPAGHGPTRVKSNDE